MCTNSRLIYNRYIRKSIFVPCGHCVACQQEKANRRAARIKNNVSPGTLTLFVTLTYSNDYVPYILRSDLKSESFEIPVYRNAEVRYTFNPHTGKYKLSRDYGIHEIDRVFVPLEARSNSSIFPLKGLNGLSREKIGVCIHSDFQKFIKRLRQYHQRILKHEIKFSYYLCTEYGSTSQRPHAHLLFFIPTAYEEEFRRSIVETWTYADMCRTEKYVEIARDAANYVASYVNCSHLLSEIMQTNDFRQKHSYSQAFGQALDCFKLSQILQKIERGDLSYYSGKKHDGTSCVDVLPIPTYVLNRYFPKFKGYSVLPASTLSRILLDPTTASFELSDKGFVNSFAPQYDYSPRECYDIAIRLNNAYERFYNATGLNRFDFQHYYEAAWNVHFNTCLKLSYKDVHSISDLNDFYENIRDIKQGLVKTDFDISSCQVDPNARSDIVIHTNKLIDIYYKRDKSRKVTNYVMVATGHNV